MSWYRQKKVDGWAVCYDAEDGRHIWFYPTQYGRCGALYDGTIADLKKISFRLALLRMYAGRRRFGHAFSDARSVLAGTICSDLNGAGIRPLVDPVAFLSRSERQRGANA